MENAVIGVFDDYEHARNAADALVEAGFKQWAVQVTPKEESMAARVSAMDDREKYSSSSGWSIGSFFRTLFGTDADHEHGHAYSEALRRGSFLVTVEAEREEDVERAREVMGQFHPIDMEERASHWRARGWSRFETGSKPYSDEQVSAERSSYASMPGQSGQRGNANVRSFARTRGGASPGGGSDVGGIHGGGITGDRPAAAVNTELSSSDTAGAGGSGLLSGADALRSDDGVPAGTPAGTGNGMPRTGSMSDMAAMSGGMGSDVTGMAGEAHMPNPAPGSRAESGMSSNHHAADTQEGALPTQSHEMGGMQASAMGAGEQTLADDASHSYRDTARVGGGAGFGAADTSRPTGSGGTIGGLGADNADLHESSRTPPAMSSGSMMGDSMGGGNMGARQAPDAGITAAGMAGDAGDRMCEEVLGGESLGRDTMGGGATGSAREAVGAGSSSGDPSSMGIIPGGSNNARQSESVYDEGLGRQTAARVHTADEDSSGTMSNAVQRDSTAPDIYHVDQDADYRTHWQKAYNMEGRYEDFEPAYRYGAQLRNNDSYKGVHHWNDLEPEARRQWEADQSRGPWDKARDAVRHAWENMKD